MRLLLAGGIGLAVFFVSHPVISFLVRAFLPPPLGAPLYRFNGYRAGGILFGLDPWQVFAGELAAFPLALLVAGACTWFFYRSRDQSTGLYLLLFALTAANLFLSVSTQGSVRRAWYRVVDGNLELFERPDSAAEELTFMNLPVALAQTGTCKRIEAPLLHRLYDLSSGAHLAWYWRSPDGELAFFNGACYHPRIGIRLRQITPEILDEWIQKEPNNRLVPFILPGFYVGSLTHPDQRMETVTLKIEARTVGAERVFGYVLNASLLQQEGSFVCRTEPCEVQLGDSIRLMPRITKNDQLILEGHSGTGGTSAILLRKRP